MNEQQIAVIIATKNRPDLLEKRALYSVLQQSKLPKYLIVVDDSQEEIRQQNKPIVDSLLVNDCHIHYLMNKRTPGASGAWNTAIDYVCSHYGGNSDTLFLAFLDDDDEWHSSYLECCLGRASSGHYSMVAAGFYRYENNSKRPAECSAPKLLNEELFLKGNPGIQGSNLFLTLDTILMAGCFDEHLSSCTDRDLCIRLSELQILHYCRINAPLLNHYADDNRQRLSTPNSIAKKGGLAAFWKKYYGRMNHSQREAFLKRAQKLFNWKPETAQQLVSEPSIQIGLTLGIELGSISFDQLSYVIEIIYKEAQQYLVGFNLVLTATQALNWNDLNEFLECAGEKGITCYNLCAEETCLETVTRLVAKENIGHCAWILRAWQPQEQLLEKDGSTILTFLEGLGAYQLCFNSLDEQFKKQRVQLVQKLEQCRISAAQARVKKLFNVCSLQLLGVGTEATVMTDGIRVFKSIDYWKTRRPVQQIQFLKQSCSKWSELPGLYALDEVISCGRNIVLTYPYEMSSPYQGGDSEQVINLLYSCSKAGIVCNNIHPKNLIKTQSEVKLVDYGSDIRPWNELGFEHMARRAYLTIHHAGHPHLKSLMRQSLHTTNMPEMRGYPVFRQQLTGIDCNLKQAQQVKLPLALPEKTTPFNLTIGVITGDAHKLLPLLNSIAELKQCSFLLEVSTIVLCNGCSASSLEAVIEDSKRLVGNVRTISEEQQVEDAENGLFGIDLTGRRIGQVGIAHARCMLQKYVGLKCELNPDSIAWILDDDMRLDARANQYLAWLPRFKQKGIDVVIGQYEGSSPNPPLNGLRGQLSDLLHNIHWLDTLPSDIELPDRSSENAILRNKYPDYYYDLSRKHSAHVEVPFWLEPAYKGETVAEARVRLFAHAPLLLTGFPLTRGIIPTCSVDPLILAKDTVNRGGNTFVLNPKALTQTPNLIPKINDREMRRSDMIWALVNKYHHGLSIKSAPFPVQHSGRVQNEKTLNLKKVCDEIMGSSLFAGLQEFLLTKDQHNLVFTYAEISSVWQNTRLARDTRLARLKHSFYRINGLAQALSQFPELKELCEYLTRSFNTTTIAKLEVQVKQMNEQHIHEFLNQIVPQTTNFANARPKSVETIV